MCTIRSALIGMQRISNMDTQTSNTAHESTDVFQDNGDYSWQYYVKDKLITDDEFNEQLAHTSYYTT